jgi:cytochrome c biogenesis protein CcmG/thiol:disulfide interchange protein DsbE
LGAAIFFAAVLLVALGAAMRRSSTGPVPGEPAPDFALQTFDGEAISLDEFRGQVVVLNFWASWCLPCAAEAADLEAIWEAYRDRGVVLIGIGHMDTRPEALAYLAQHAVTYPNAPDRGGLVAQRYRLGGVPETFVIDHEGRLVALDEAGTRDRVAGPIVGGTDFTPADLRALLDELTAGAGG